ncbi:hypothetical protein DL771_011542 [Monosporascus sp. 5C6A]|nr:hypothetical protein DL771_011542 [Monosporascus sp. 5C6A]
MVEPPAERWDHATDMTLSLVRCEAIQTGWKLGLIKQKQPRGPASSNAPIADDSRKPPKKRLTLIQNLEARLCDKYLPICDSSVRFQLLSSAVARIILARFWLITQYSVASRQAEADDRNKSSLFPGIPDSTGQLENNMRDELFQISIGILEFPECDRAWDCVTTVYDGWKVGGNQDDESRLALWWPIRRLMAKACYVREMQRTDPGRPAQAGWRAERHDPAPCLPTAGSLSHYPLTTHTSAWYTPSQQTMSSIPTPQSSLSGLSPVPYSK